MKKAPPRRGLYCPALQPAVTLLRPSSPAAGSGCVAAVPAAVAAAGRGHAPPADHAGPVGNSDCAAGPSRISGSRGRDAAVEAILCRAGLNPCGDLHTNPSRLHCSDTTALFFRVFRPRCHAYSWMESAHVHLRRWPSHQHEHGPMRGNCDRRSAQSQKRDWFALLL